MADKLLNEQVIGQVQEAFQGLQEPVQVLFFGRKTDCAYCDDTRQLLEEVTGISDKLSLQVYDLDEDADLAAQYGIDKAPGFLLAGYDGEELVDYGVHFAGIPAGHEFSTLIHDLLLVSGRDSNLGQETRDFLAGLDKPVHLQVFVTPT